MLGNLCSGLVPDHTVERRNNRRRRLGEGAGALNVGLETVDGLVGEHPCCVREQSDRLEQRGSHHRNRDVELERSRRARPRDCGVIADDARAHHQHGLRDDRVDLAWHDRRPRLEVGDVQLADARVRAGPHPTQVVADLGETNRDRAKRSGCVDQAVTIGLSLEVVSRFSDRQFGLVAEQLDHELGEPCGCVDSCAHRCSTERNLGDPGERGLHALNAEANLAGVTAELLAERDGRRIHQVGATGLHRIRPTGGFALEGEGQVVEGGDKVVDECARDCNVHRGGKHVVRGLGGVDVIVRVHRATEAAGGQGREHLVHVHV